MKVLEAAKIAKDWTSTAKARSEAVDVLLERIAELEDVAAEYRHLRGRPEEYGMQYIRRIQMPECPSAAADRYNADLDAQAEAEMEGEEREKISKKMLAKWNQATGCYHDTWDQAMRCYNKYTACGPWLQHSDDKIAIGSIVEGVEECAGPIQLDWPFTVKDVRRAMKEIEFQADEIWNRTHGCEKCGPYDEWGDRAVNPKCKACGGHGEVI